MKFEVDELESEACFPCPVYSENGEKIAAPGIKFTESVHKQLADWGIDVIRAEQPPLPEPLKGSQSGARRRFRVDQLSSGVVFDCPIYTPNGQKLADSFARLNQKQLKKLNNWDIRIIYAKNSPLSREEKDKYRQQAAKTSIEDSFTEIEAEALKDIENQSAVRSCERFHNRDKKYVRAVYQKSLDLTEDLIEKLSRNLVNKLSRIYETLKPINPCIWQKQQLLLFLIADEKIAGDEYIYKYSLHTAIISMLLGQKMGFPRGEIRRLGAGALVHDVGMLKIPRIIRKKEGKLTYEQREKMKKHLPRGEDMLSELDSYHSSIQHVLEQHHEQYDGSGYPNHLTGDEIHPHARIVNLAMTYVALTQPRYHRREYGVTRSVREVIYEQRSRYDPGVLKAFLKLMGIYPPGSFVRLSGGQEAMVIETVESKPLDPVVRVVADDEGNRLQKPYRLLLEKSELSIEGILDSDKRGYKAFEIA